MSDLGTIVSAALGTIGPVGAGAAFIWREFKKLQRDVNECKSHRAKDQERQRLTIEMSLQLCMHGPPPRNKAVRPLAHLLRATFDLSEPLPPDWLHLLDQIEAKHKAQRVRKGEA